VNAPIMMKPTVPGDFLWAKCILCGYNKQDHDQEYPNMSSRHTATYATDAWLDHTMSDAPSRSALQASSEWGETVPMVVDSRGGKRAAICGV
jgi:hypothetical protein